ncbi:MAG: hypothetical protein JSV00_08840 [bacterium]|nr:MAG: hypothetical protein JSV00_08840 [bacterium]
MKTGKILVPLSVVLAVALSAAVAAAADFDWTRDFNIRAEADRDGFRAQLSTRFKIGDTQVQVVLGNVDSPADAYMVLRLGEMSSRPVDEVLDRYRTEKGKGWGALAMSLGIKPGSKEFQALKQGSDITGSAGGNKGNGKDKGKGKG